MKKNPRVRDLLPATYALLSKYLKNYDRPPLKEIAAAAGVGIEWLRKFKARRTHDFGVRKVQTLHNYLLRKLRQLEKRRARTNGTGHPKGVETRRRLATLAKAQPWKRYASNRRLARVAKGK